LTRLNNYEILSIEALTLNCDFRMIFMITMIFSFPRFAWERSMDALRPVEWNAGLNRGLYGFL